MLANLTGSLRLFVGFGWPMVFIIHCISSRVGRARKWPAVIKMPSSFAIEATFLWVPILYFLGIAVRNRIVEIDGVILCGMYIAYLALLNFQRIAQKGIESTDDEPEHEADLEWVPRKIAALSRPAQLLVFNGMFIIGGAILYLAVHPFVEGLKSAAIALGMTEFVFIQWVAPFASEMPEKITAVGSARKASKVPMAIFNMVSSSVNQWTLLAGLVPLIYAMSPNRSGPIEFDQFQHVELMLTVAQSALGALFLADLQFAIWEAGALFILWIVQFLKPDTREEILIATLILIIVKLGELVLKGRWPRAWKEFIRIFKVIVTKVA